MAGFGLAGNKAKTAYEGDKGQTISVDEANRLPVETDPKKENEQLTALEEIRDSLLRIEKHLQQINTEGIL